jgi:hypothetical protein
MPKVGLTRELLPLTGNRLRLMAVAEDLNKTGYSKQTSPACSALLCLEPARCVGQQHVMKVCGGDRGIAPLILSFGSRRR